MLPKAISDIYKPLIATVITHEFMQPMKHITYFANTGSNSAPQPENGNGDSDS